MKTDSHYPALRRRRRLPDLMTAVTVGVFLAVALTLVLPYF